MKSINRLLRRSCLHQLAQLQHGGLTLVEGQFHQHFGDATSPLQAKVEIHEPAFWQALALEGSIGAADAWIHGHWDSPDLTAVIRVLVANMEILDAMEGGLAVLKRATLRITSRLQHNSRRAAKRNIAAHYDLGNDLFEAFLDPSMMYSAAMFQHPGDSLATAQHNKLERICQKLQLQPGEHLLEIGTGWGSLAIHAAQHYGCHVTTTTLSQAQYAHTKARIQELGLEDRITLLLEDYRDLSGQYDKLVSVEMIEAVGHEFLPLYFQHCNNLLKTDGLMLLQSITIRDQREQQARNNVDFIQRYIFPGGALPSVTSMMTTISGHSDMNLIHLEDFGADYANTLKCWHDNFNHASAKLAEAGYDATFQRLWRYYFCYCEGAFLERAIGVVQMLLAKPQARPNIWATTANGLVQGAWSVEKKLSVAGD